jgi:predicted tellurium resistance membrane protein TerC
MIPPEQIWVMVVAILVSVVVMLVGAKPIADYVTRHPTMKVLALAFLILIGVMLVAEGIGQHIAKGTVYFAMAFAVLVELFNLRVRRKAKTTES